MISNANADEPTADQAAPTQSTEVQAAETPPEIALWIAELDSDQYLVREQATRRLLENGDAALDPLLAAANGNRPEPADRAIWILQKLARRDNPTLSRRALMRLVQLRDHPQVVAEAHAELARISLQLCQRNLEALGAEVSAQLDRIPMKGIVAPVVHVRLGEKWRGRLEDLRPLAEETYHQHFLLEGAHVDDAVVKLFEAKEDLSWLQLDGTNVSVAAVDSLKKRRPQADLYLRNDALMGVAAETHQNGVVVILVPPENAAAAAGVQVGDVILALDGAPLPDFDRLTAHIAQHKPRDKVTLDIQRGEKKLSIEVTLGSRVGQPY